MRRLGIDVNQRNNLAEEEESASADEDVIVFMNQAIEGQEQILSGDVCNKWTLAFFDKNNEGKYTSIMVKNTHGEYIIMFFRVEKLDYFE